MSKAAQNAIIGNFAAVKKAGVQLQTKLGGRTSNIGVNVIGSFAETKNEAFGWHLRGYGGDEDTFGANAGLFYREIDDGMLFGANAFVDYESGDDGKFSRVGIGGEIKHKNAGVVVNYYAPIGHDKQVNSTVAAFSRRGFDAKLRITAPYFNALKAAADYYNFAGKDGIKDQDGLRYGAELHLSPGFHLGVFYDDGAEKVGGELAYAHTIGEVQGRKSGGEFAPDMFAAVSREYSQRIVTMAITAIAAVTLPQMTSDITMTNVTLPQMTSDITMTNDMELPPVLSVVIATMRTTTSMEIPIITASRAASVNVITRLTGNQYRIILSISNRVLVTLPPADSSRPFVITVMRALQGHAAVIVDTNHPNPNITVGRFSESWFDGTGVRTYIMTVVEGSEEFLSVTVTMTTKTPVTTFSTMTVTIGANSAMGAIPPDLQHKRAARFGVSQVARTFLMDSRLRGNDGLLLRHNDGGGKFLVVAKPPPPALFAAAVIPAAPSRHSRAAFLRHSRANGAEISQPKKGDSRAIARE